MSPNCFRFGALSVGQQHFEIVDEKLAKDCPTIHKTQKKVVVMSTYQIIHYEDPWQDGTSTEYPFLHTTNERSATSWLH